MSNYFKTNDKVDFWVWINPNNWLVAHQIKVTGGFTSGGLLGNRKSNLMFTPNPDFQGEITPFQLGIMREYMAEYNLELGREVHAKSYPSRLNAIYLLNSEEEANLYKDRHMYHVGDRVLKRVHSVGPCVYSTHDSSWVDFLRLTHSVDSESVEKVSQAYWSGHTVESCSLSSMGRPWTQSPIMETLYIGRVEFYDRNL
jgi:hypothetical protein